MTISVNTIGTFGGKRVDEAVLTSNAGVQVNIMNWGVVVRDWQVPVEGGTRSAVLGFDEFAPYPAHSPHLGSLAGRVANRIRDGRFELDGKTYQLNLNQGDFHLHGGSEGLGRQVWDMDTNAADNSIKFTFFSPDGAMGYPGNVAFEAIYRLTGNRLRLELSGMPDRPTPISLVQHQYFNLGVTNSVVDHVVHMPHSVARTQSDDKLVMTGVISPVQGTVYDFLQPRTMRDEAGAPLDYDLNLVMATGRRHSDPIAIVTGEDQALTLKLWSDQPGVQLYNGVWTDVAVPGHGGRFYKKHSGLCFEDQMFPDAVNQPHFPNIICTPDRPYRHWCEIEIAAAS